MDLVEDEIRVKFSIEDEIGFSMDRFSTTVELAGASLVPTGKSLMYKDLDLRGAPDMSELSISRAFTVR